MARSIIKYSSCCPKLYGTRTGTIRRNGDIIVVELFAADDRADDVVPDASLPAACMAARTACMAAVLLHWCVDDP